MIIDDYKAKKQALDAIQKELNEHNLKHRPFFRLIQDANERIQYLERIIAAATDFDEYKRLQADLEKAKEDFERLEFDQRVSKHKIDELQTLRQAAFREFSEIDQRCHRLEGEMMAAERDWHFAEDKAQENAIKLRKAKEDLDRANEKAAKDKERHEYLQAEYAALLAEGIVKQFKPFVPERKW